MTGKTTYAIDLYAKLRIDMDEHRRGFCTVGEDGLITGVNIPPCDKFEKLPLYNDIMVNELIAKANDYIRANGTPTHSPYNRNWDLICQSHPETGYSYSGYLFALYGAEQQ